MGRKFDPYHKWLGIAPDEQPADYYRLLAIKRFEADPDVIHAAADQRMAHLRNYQTGQHADLSQRLLNEVAAARVCLLTPAKKAAYDKQLQARAAKETAAAKENSSDDYKLQSPAPSFDLLDEAFQEMATRPVRPCAPAFGLRPPRHALAQRQNRHRRRDCMRGADRSVVLEAGRRFAPIGRSKSSTADRDGGRSQTGKTGRGRRCQAPVGGGLGQIDCEGWAACCEPPVGGGAGQTVCDEADVADGGAGHTVCDGWDCADGGDGQSVCAVRPAAQPRVWASCSAQH